MTRTTALTALWSLTLAATLSACAGGAQSPQTETGPTPAGQDDSETLPPPGFGTLRQDDFTVALQSNDLQVKVTPLSESVIRLAAPDTYQRLHALVSSRRERIREIARNAGFERSPKAFLVSFFTRTRQAEYKPTDLQLLSQGILHRPLGILPITPEWGREQVEQERAQSAIYVFNPAIDLEVAFQVEYSGARSTAWSSILGLLEAEEGRVRSRSKS